MLTIRTLRQVRSAGHLKGFHASRTSTGVPIAGLATGGLRLAETVRSNSESRRRWLARQWAAHGARARARDRVE
ncbi:MAG: hypothetical protein HY000_21295 [Planctomycetes bacterium]|nr:hypothetical protein [Planctomycetota bacterium]